MIPCREQNRAHFTERKIIEKTRWAKQEVHIVGVVDDKEPPARAISAQRRPDERLNIRLILVDALDLERSTDVAIGILKTTGIDTRDLEHGAVRTFVADPEGHLQGDLRLPHSAEAFDGRPSSLWQSSGSAPGGIISRIFAKIDSRPMKPLFRPNGMSQ